MTGLQYNVARAAYEAYDEARNKGERLPPWDNLSPDRQRVWFQVAKAVI